MVQKLKFDPPESWKVIHTLEMHTGGEPLRIITDGLPEIKGNTILEKRNYFKDKYDFIRKGLMWEPRGHADMYGAILTEPVTPDGDFGVFFLHNEGYSTMCGHAIIGLTKMVIETGLIQKKGKEQELKIDTPSGRVLSYAIADNNVVKKVRFRNVPSFVYLKDKEVEVPGIGMVNFDAAFGGAFYALCDVKQLGINMDATDYDKLVDYGKRIKKAVNGNFNVRHSEHPELGFLYGVIFIGDPYDYHNHSRNVCVFADGEVDRSATGTGVSARAALHYANGDISLGEEITIESILGSTMQVKVVEETKVGVKDAVIPEVSGSAWFTGRNECWFDPDDPLKEGFIFR